VFAENTDRVREILLDAVTRLPAADARPCACGHALNGLKPPFDLP
jgi:5'-methylthioadenosine phosphorylase